MLELRVLLLQLLQPFGLVHLQPAILLAPAKELCSVISASLHANGVVFLFVTATSICRNRFTTCLGVCFFLLAIIRSLNFTLSYKN